MRLATVAAIALVAACGSGDKKKNEGSDPAPKVVAGDASSASRALPSVTVGVEDPRAFNFPYGKGRKAFDPVEKAVEKGDWAAVETAAAATIEADPEHLDAQFLLARARAEQAKPDVIEPLAVALAADYPEYAARLKEAAALSDAVTADAGARARVDAIRQTYLDRARTGMLVVARRTSFRSPKKKRKKVQWAATRAELYSYDRETERYLRLTHTKSALAGWLMAPSGDELAFVAYSGVVVPAAEGQPTLLGWAKIGVLDWNTLELRGELVNVPDTPRRIRLGYKVGDELVVETADADGRWGVTNQKVWVLDRGAGTLEETELALDTDEILSVDYDRVTLERDQVAEVQADPEATSFRLLPTNTTVTMPSGEVVGSGGYFWSPDKVHLVVRTLARPCEDEREASLYLVDAATGKLKNVLRGPSRFQTRWIDNDHFVYEDDEGTLRIYDVEERTQVGRLETRGDMSLVGVASGRGPLCREEGAAEEEIPEDPMPPELEGEGDEDSEE